MSATQPTPQTWTLRFKNRRTTILLHVDPLQKLSTVKSELLKAVQQTHPSGELNGVAISQNSSDIVLARPRDINDLSAGFESIEPKRDAFLNGEDSGKGKGKAASGGKRANTSKSASTDCPQAAGLRDGGIVAFKFRTEDEGWYKVQDEKDAIIQIDDDDDEGGSEWDVVVPTIEETYGEGLPAVDRMEEDDG